MNKFAANLGTILTDNHLRLPVLAIGALDLAAIWFPQYKAQLSASQAVLDIYMAGHATNSSPSDPPKP